MLPETHPFENPAFTNPKSSDKWISSFRHTIRIIWHPQFYFRAHIHRCEPLQTFVQGRIRNRPRNTLPLLPFRDDNEFCLFYAIRLLTSRNKVWMGLVFVVEPFLVSSPRTNAFPLSLFRWKSQKNVGGEKNVFHPLNFFIELSQCWCVNADTICIKIVINKDRKL